MKIFRMLNKNFKIYEKQVKNVKFTRKPVESIHSVLFGKHLLITNTISSGFLMFAGDLVSQKFENRKLKIIQPIDWIRCGKMFVVGAIQGPIGHFFYGWLDRWMYVVSFQTVIKKILLDQLIMSPTCILAFFYPACLLDGYSTSQCIDEIKNKFLKVYMMDWTVWPIIQFINFYYLDPKYRVIYVNIITMLYNVYLSYVKHEDMYENVKVNEKDEKVHENKNML